MFRHTSRLQFESRPAKPDPVYAHKLQELIGGAYGEMTVTMQYLFQGWNCRMPGKYKDLIMDVATEEIGHVEMIATMKEPPQISRTASAGDDADTTVNPSASSARAISSRSVLISLTTRTEADIATSLPSAAQSSPSCLPGSVGR